VLTFRHTTVRAVARSSGMFELSQGQQQSGADDGVNSNRSDPRASGQDGALAIGSNGDLSEGSRTRRCVRNSRRGCKEPVKRGLFLKGILERNGRKTGSFGMCLVLISTIPYPDIRNHLESLGGPIHPLFMVEVAQKHQMRIYISSYRSCAISVSFGLWGIFDSDVVKRIVSES
jgi:hypothetical protein